MTIEVSKSGPWAGEAGAGHLFARVRDACGGDGDFPVRLEAGLRAAFDMLAADPELAQLLTLAPYFGTDDGALHAQREWIWRFGRLLQAAAASDPRTTHEADFLAPYLIGSVCFQIRRLVSAGEGSDLLRLLPGTVDALLVYHFEPRSLARAGMGIRD